MNNNKKIRVGILFGGRSAEHEISLLSAKNVVDALNKEKYDIYLIGIDKEGEWHLRDAYQYLLHADNAKLVRLHGSQGTVALIPKKQGKEIVKYSGKELQNPLQLDVIFPVLHGTYGEDGTVQGLLKLANIPFVGASVLGSAVGMDKDVMKRLMRDANLPIAKFIVADQVRMAKLDFAEVIRELGLPLFVKPANLGSSIGISKVKTQKDLLPACEEAFRYDRKIIIEEFIAGREMECSVMGNEHPVASVLGEVIAHDEFYSYDAKYMENGSDFIIPPNVNAKISLKMRELAINTYQALCCEGLARIDFFLKNNGDVIVNEINTIPGFTNTSMFPKLWEASGVSKPELMDQLIQFAIERHLKEKSLKTTF